MSSWLIEDWLVLFSAYTAADTDNAFFNGLDNPRKLPLHSVKLRALQGAIQLSCPNLTVYSSRELPCSALSTPATMSKQRWTLSKQHSTLLLKDNNVERVFPEISSFWQSRNKLKQFTFTIYYYTVYIGSSFHFWCQQRGCQRRGCKSGLWMNPEELTVTGPTRRPCQLRCSNAASYAHYRCQRFRGLPIAIFTVW